MKTLNLLLGILLLLGVVGCETKQPPSPSGAPSSPSPQDSKYWKMGFDHGYLFGGSDRAARIGGPNPDYSGTFKPETGKPEDMGLFRDGFREGYMKGWNEH
jgi:hypothetical protein